MSGLDVRKHSNLDILFCSMTMKGLSYCLVIFWICYICYFTYMLITGEGGWWSYLFRLVMTISNLYLAIDYIRRKKDA